MNRFKLHSSFQPTGDQPQAIKELCRGLKNGEKFQILEGVTGSGKTFTAANVIEYINRPTLVVSHNKTLAAQLYSELKEFFPENAVEYFVSYYDYYQPEAYIPQTDTYIEKDASINSEIERMRLSATNSLLSRNDVIIVASVSCIYGLGSPEDYSDMLVRLEKGCSINRDKLLQALVDIQYSRNDYESEPGSFRVRGDTVDIFPSYSEHGIRLEMFGDEIDAIRQTDVLTGNIEADLDKIVISPAKHFVMPHKKVKSAISSIMAELKERINWLEGEQKLLEAQRLRGRTMFDIQMLKEIGTCSGIENYSRHLSGRGEGEPPATLLDYFKEEFLTIIDESHVTFPQLQGMYNGDQSRKNTLIEHGFRLPSARDNRPLRIDEFMKKVGQVIFTTATPGARELDISPKTIQQVIRPTGLLDPPIEVRPLKHQIDDLMEEIRAHAKRGERTLATTLTKRTAEDLADYLREAGLKAEYLHSEIKTLDRVDILMRLRKCEFDCLVGINLLREGLDLPEVALVAILDADKEGFLRSVTSLIQTAGRTARHVNGKVILYADVMTESMRKMIAVTRERRERQMAYNLSNNITPRSIEKKFNSQIYSSVYEAEHMAERIIRESGVKYDVFNAISEVKKEMLEAAEHLEFERAAVLRDEMLELEKGIDVLPAQEEQTGKKTKKRLPRKEKF